MWLFEVLNQKLDVLLFLSKEAPFTACCFAIILNEILEKIADSKHAGACKLILSFSAEALSFQHVSEKVGEGECFISPRI